MGMEQIVRFRTAPPTWTAARDLLAARGYTFQVRMIDGQLAFPDEQPPETWRELRLSTPQGMITVRREADRVVFVTWGNADAVLCEQCNALAWAFAEAGGDAVERRKHEPWAKKPLATCEVPAARRQRTMLATKRPGSNELPGRPTNEDHVSNEPPKPTNQGTDD
jgi:hypothetical protein